MVSTASARAAFVRNAPVQYRNPAGPVLAGRFGRYLNGTRQRAVVWFPEVIQPVGGTIRRPKTVNVRHLERLPDELSPSHRRRNRRQAIEAYPILTALFVRRSKRKYSAEPVWEPARWSLGRLGKSERLQIIRAIDQGEPLLPVLTRTLRVQPWMLRHLHTHAAAFFEVFDGAAMAALRSIRWATPELAPTDAATIATLKLLGDEVDTLVDWSVGDNRRAFRQLIGHHGRTRNLVDYLKFLRQLTAWIASTGTTVRGETYRERLGIGTIGDLLELSRIWHDIILRQPFLATPPGIDPDAAPVPPASWPPVLEEPVRIGDYDFESLTTRRALCDESAGLDHCVATYLNRCVEGAVHILSIRSLGCRIGTAALVRDHNLQFGIEQASGLRNADLEDDVWIGLVELVRRLNTREIRSPFLSPATHWGALAQYRFCRDVAAREYFGASGGLRRADHFALLAEVFGRDGFNQYRRCLETGPGRGSLYVDALRAAGVVRRS